MARFQKTVYQFRRGTASEFYTADPVLRAGEPAVELDTNKLKIGDGVTTYRLLNYIGDASSINQLLESYLFTLENYDENQPQVLAHKDNKLMWIDIGTLQDT